MTGAPGPGAGSGFTAGSVDLYGHMATAPAAERCPHCNGVAGVNQSQELGTVCKLCGAPRIQSNGFVLTEATNAVLRRAEAARSSRGLLRGTAFVGGLGLGFALFLLLAIGLVAGFGWGLAVFATIGGPSALALAAGLVGGSRRTKEIALQLDAAWSAAAADAAVAGKAATPTDLASALGVDLGRAEQLHAMLTVDAIASSRDVANLEAPRVRIVTHPDARPGSETTLPPDPRFEELERRAASEAEAESEADAAASRARGGRS